MSGRSVRLGAGAGFAGDRLDPAVDLARRGALDFLVFECLGERTVAAAHARKLRDPSAGYDPLLGTRLRAVLPHTTSQGTTLISNSGAANPDAAGELAGRIATGLGVPARIAVVSGDDVLDAVRAADPVLWETGAPLSSCTEELISANAYLGAAPIVEALDHGADIVLTGRVADPALFLGPLLHTHGWHDREWELLGAGTAVGHLLECAGQLTGGYFGDPVTKPVPEMARLGFPFADVARDGTAELGKLDGTGGRLDRRTCAEQLLYEVDDPTAYRTPDVVADFSAVTLIDAGEQRVRVRGATGRPRPDELKVTLGFRGGWQGEGQISYAGPRALDRARWAADIVRERLARVHDVDETAIRVEYVGAGAAFRGLAAAGEPVEVRLRVSARVPDADRAEAIGWEVEALYTNGPAAGGGATKTKHEAVIVRSALLPRRLVAPSVRLVEV